VLQAIEKKYKDRGVSLLALSVDTPADQPKIPAFLKKYGLGCRVLLAGDEGIEGYNFYAASSLFVIDRKGQIAGIPSEFYFKIEDELEKRLPDLLAGKPTPGPLLWSVQKAPEGFGELWHASIEGTVTSVSIAPGSASRPPEIAVLDEGHHFRRYSATGELLSNVTLEDDKTWGIVGVDLDGNGVNEWIARQQHSFKVLDESGEPYWTYYEGSGDDWLEIGGFFDLDGDGRKEIVVRVEDTVAALRNVPRPLWKLKSFSDVKALKVDSRGRIRVQDGSTVWNVDARGRRAGAAFRVPGDTVFLGEAETGSALSARFFGSRYLSKVDVEHDLDGDGRTDVVVAQRGGVRVFTQEGALLASLFIAENQGYMEVALADLDGRPGDEMVFFVPQYGLVALGRKGSVRTPSAPDESASTR
jgi:VCBS repeat protein